jgi:hypothetical protein
LTDENPQHPEAEAAGSRDSAPVQASPESSNGGSIGGSIGGAIEGAFGGDAPEAGRTDDADDADTATDRDDGPEPRRPTLDTSAPAIAATIALVAFSIFIGVVGPRLGNRQQLPPGTTLVELADAMTVRHSESVVGAIHSTDEPPFERAEIEREFARFLGREVAVPDLRLGLEPLRFQWAGIRGIRLPGARGACAFGRFRGDSGPDFLSVAVLRDEGNFIVFDPHGRPIPLPEGEMFSVSVEGREFGSTVLAYREGDLVFALQADSADALERFAARFRAAAVERAARSSEPAPESVSDDPSDNE